MARELALLVCAFFFWRLSPDAPGSGGHAFMHRRGYGVVLTVLIGLSFVEMSIVHLLLRPVSVLASNVILAFSAYAIVWLLGDFHALRLRPVLVVGGSLCVRVGLRSEAVIPLDDVERVESLPASGEPRSDYVRCTVFGPPEVLVRLRKKARVEPMFGPAREVSCIGLAVEDTAHFVRSVSPAARY